MHSLRFALALLPGLAACVSHTSEPTRPALSDRGRMVDGASPERPPQAGASDARPKAAEGGDDPRALAEAQDLLRQGQAAYHIGAYDEAEALLKRSITLYPFLAQANLALGKIFLLKGAATRDEALIQSARLMFDMAHTIDPQLREPLVLLELFKPRGN